MQRLLENKTAIITGANQGLGLQIARNYLDAGASVMLCARDSGLLQETSRSLASRVQPSQQILVQPADVSNTTDVESVVNTAMTAFGHIDILVNNAGIARPQRIDEISETDWDEVIDINLKSCFLVTQAFVPGMRTRKWGRIINLS